MKNLIARFVREEEGQDLVEYALLIAFIALACIVGLPHLGTAINTTYSRISSTLMGASLVTTIAADGRPAVSAGHVTGGSYGCNGLGEHALCHLALRRRRRARRTWSSMRCLARSSACVGMLVWQNIVDADGDRYTTAQHQRRDTSGRRRSPVDGAALTRSSRDVAVLLVGLAACVTDLRSRRIPNVLTFGASVAALVFWTWTAGLPGLGLSLAGWLVGCAAVPALVPAARHGRRRRQAAGGAGRLGWGRATRSGSRLCAGLAGGVLAWSCTLVTGYFRTMVRNVWGLLMFWRMAGVQPHPELTLATAGRPAAAVRLSNHRGCSGCAMAPINSLEHAAGRTRGGPGGVRA